MARTRSQSGAGSGVGVSDGERDDASVSPLLDGSKSGSAAAAGLDEQSIIAHAPCNHSWRYSPVKYTAASIAIWIVFFYQPHWLRVQVWTAVRSTIADERLFYIVASVLLHLLVWVCANGGMALIYLAEHPFFEQFKIQSKPWPWHRGAEESAAYFKLIRKSFPLIAFNHWILAPALMWLSYDGNAKLGINGNIDAVPHWYTTLWQIAVFMLIEDTLFYWAHRALHHPAIYGHVHKVHHTYKTSIGLASEYAHPVEFVLSNVVPFVAGPTLCRAHYFTIFMWTILRIGETVDGHSGYEMPWSPYRLLPCSGSSTAHDFHHSHNVGNFGSFFTWWDQICGTDQAFIRWEIKQAAKTMEQQQQQQQAAAAAAAAGGKAVKAE